MIGDHPHDVALATNAGSQGIYVLTGHGKKHRELMPKEALVATGIGEAVELIWRLGDNREIEKGQ